MSSSEPSESTPADKPTAAHHDGLRSRVSGLPPSARVATLVVVALLAGGGAGFAIGHDSAGSSHAQQSVDASFGQRFDGGGVAGEQHVQGTLTAKTGDTITVKTSSGSTATYTIDSTTQIVRNGQTTSLSSLQAGDPVLVHVYPSSSGKQLVEMVLAGSSASGGGFGGRPDGGGFGDGGPGDGGFGGDGGNDGNGGGFTPQTGGSSGGVSIN